jgi:hypothetical protein
MRGIRFTCVLLLALSLAGAGRAEPASDLREISEAGLRVSGVASWRDWDTECLDWITDAEAKYISGEDAYFWLRYSRYCGANLLMSIAPRADGSIHPEEARALVELARIIDSRGWPPVVHPVPVKDAE